MSDKVLKKNKYFPLIFFNNFLNFLLLLLVLFACSEKLERDSIGIWSPWVQLWFPLNGKKFVIFIEKIALSSNLLEEERFNLTCCHQHYLTPLTINLAHSHCPFQYQMRLSILTIEWRLGAAKKTFLLSRTI